MILKNKKFLITGGSGFVGTNLLSKLLNYSNKIINIDIKEPLNKKHLIYWKNLDINSYKELEKTIISFSPDFIFNLAAKTDLNGKKIQYYKTNTIGSENILKICLKLKNLKRSIFFSTRLVCETGYTPKNDADYCPTTIYGESKIIGEKILKLKKYKKFTRWINVRPTSLWGPWFGEPYKDFFDRVKRGHYLHPKGRKILKSFGYVENSIFQIIKLTKAPLKLVESKTFYLCDYKDIEVKSFANKIAFFSKVRRPFEVPLVILHIIAKFGDLLKIFNIKFSLTSFRLNNLLTDMKYDTLELKKITGKLPISLDKGILKTINWIEK